MVITLGPLRMDAGIHPSQAFVIRHAYARESEESGLVGLHADPTHAEIPEYARGQSSDTRRSPAMSPRLRVVFIKEGGGQARLFQ